MPELVVMSREDFEGACCVRGYVVREWCDAPSNFRTDCDLDTYLKEQGVPGLCGVDTRELTRILQTECRARGVICGAEEAMAYLMRFEDRSAGEQLSLF